MTRSQMIETVARKTGFTEAQVETTMDALFDQIADCLRADEKVTIAGFGRFQKLEVGKAAKSVEETA